MYDTVNMTHWTGGESIDYMDVVQYIRNPIEHRSDDGLLSVTGYLPSPTGITGHDLKISINSRRVKIEKASLSKWYHGNNITCLTLAETKQCIEAINDTIHLSMDNASITRLDVGLNLLLEHKPSLYFGHLGELIKYERVQTTCGGIYYTNTLRKFVLYDKTKELKAKDRLLYDQLMGHNILRLELRLLKNIHKYLNTPRITASMLYDKQVFTNCLRLVNLNYRKIQRVNNITLDFSLLNTVSNMNKAGVAFLVHNYGYAEVSNQISEAVSIGTLTRKQAADLRKAINNACNSPVFTTNSPLIIELDEKIESEIKLIADINEINI